MLPLERPVGQGCVGERVGRYLTITLRCQTEELLMLCWAVRKNTYFDGWLTVHRSITLVDFQLDAQNSYLFTYNTFIKILYMFRALPCSSSGGLRRNCIYAASGIVTVCR